MLETLKKMLGFRKKEAIVSREGQPANIFEMFLGSRGGRIHPSKAIDEYRGWVFACVRAIADDVSAHEWQLWKSGKERDERVWDDPLLDLLRHPNPQQTGNDLRFLISAHLDLTGNAYLLLTEKDGEPVRSERTKPARLYVLNPAKVSVVVGQRGLVEEITGYEIVVGNGKTRRVEPHAVVHFTIPSPAKMLVGMGVVDGISDWLDLASLLEIYNLAFFQNGATPSGVITGERLSGEDQVRIIREQIEDRYTGANKAHKVLVLPSGLDYKPLSFTNRDIEMAERQREIRDKILAAFRVPRTILGITDDVNRANAEATNYVFALRAVKPRLDLITRQLNERLVPRFGKDLYLLYDDPVPENRELRIAEMSRAVAGQAVMSINEAREEYFGLPPIEGGDAVFGDPMAMPIGKPVGKRVNFTRHKHAHKREDEVERVVGKILADVAKEMEEDAQEEERHKAFVARIEPHIPSLKGAFLQWNERVFAEVQARVAQEATGQKEARQKINLTLEDIFHKAKWTAVLVGLVEPIARDIFGEEGVAAAGLLGYSLTLDDLMTPEVEEAIQDIARNVARSYSTTTAKQLERALREAIEEQGDLALFTQKVAKAKEYANRVRAEVAAKTEAFRVGNAARVKVWEKTGVVKSKRWYTAADERVCPLCREMHGKKVPLSHKYAEMGEVIAAGDESIVIDYDDLKYPPLHPDCRCYVVPDDINV